MDENCCEVRCEELAVRRCSGCGGAYCEEHYGDEELCTWCDQANWHIEAGLYQEARENLTWRTEK